MREAQQMCQLAKSHALSHEVFAYIYIYIYIDIDTFNELKVSHKCKL